MAIYGYLWGLLSDIMLGEYAQGRRQGKTGPILIRFSYHSHTPGTFDMQGFKWDQIWFTAHLDKTSILYVYIIYLMTIYIYVYNNMIDNM